MEDQIAILCEKARNFYDQNDYGNAIKYYKKILNSKLSEQDFKVINIELGICLFHYCKYRESIKILEDVLPKENIDENFIQIYETMGGCYFELNDFSKSIDYYSRSLSYSNDEENNSYLNLCVAKSYYFLEEYLNAEKHIIESAKVVNKLDRPIIFEYYYYYGMTKLFLKKYESAKIELINLGKYRKSNEESAMYYYAFAVYYNLIDDLEKMFDYTNKALKYRRNQKYYGDLLLYYLAIYYDFSEDKDNQKKVLIKFLKNYPDSKYLKKMTGESYYKVISNKDKILNTE